MTSSTPNTQTATTAPPPPEAQASLNDWLDGKETTARQVDVSIVVPAYNEERRLPPTLIDMIDYFDRQSFTYEIVVVDDGSRDGTGEVVKKFERVREQVKLIQLPKNQGKGHAVRLGVLNTRGKTILFADADGATPIGEFSKLYSAIQSGSEIVIGSRALTSTDTKVSTSVHRRLLGRIFNRWVNTVLLPDITDTQCGFKMFSRNTAQFLFKNQSSDRFSFDVELLYIARKAAIPVKEVAINWNNIPGSKVNLVVDSLKMLRDVLRFRVLHRGVTPELYIAATRGE
jgi:dolichyl-phosphate beta-glucosyltransferase